MWSVIAIVILVAAGIFVARLVVQVRRGEYRDADGTKRPWWTPGNGRHGGV